MDNCSKVVRTTVWSRAKCKNGGNGSSQRKPATSGIVRHDSNVATPLVFEPGSPWLHRGPTRSRAPAKLKDSKVASERGAVLEVFQYISWRRRKVPAFRDGCLSRGNVDRFLGFYVANCIHMSDSFLSLKTNKFLGGRWTRDKCGPDNRDKGQLDVVAERGVITAGGHERSSPQLSEVKIFGRLLTSGSSEPMGVIEVTMDQRRIAIYCEEPIMIWLCGAHCTIAALRRPRRRLMTLTRKGASPVGLARGGEGGGICGPHALTQTSLRQRVASAPAKVVWLRLRRSCNSEERVLFFATVAVLNNRKHRSLWFPGSNHRSIRTVDLAITPGDYEKEAEIPFQSITFLVATDLRTLLELLRYDWKTQEPPSTKRPLLRRLSERTSTRPKRARSRKRSNAATRKSRVAGVVCKHSISIVSQVIPHNQSIHECTKAFAACLVEASARNCTDHLKTGGIIRHDSYMRKIYQKVNLHAEQLYRSQLYEIMFSIARDINGNNDNTTVIRGLLMAMCVRGGRTTKARCPRMGRGGGQWVANCGVGGRTRAARRRPPLTSANHRSYLVPATTLYPLASRPSRLPRLLAFCNTSAITGNHCLYLRVAYCYHGNTSHSVHSGDRRRVVWGYKSGERVFVGRPQREADTRRQGSDLRLFTLLIFSDHVFKQLGKVQLELRPALRAQAGLHYPTYKLEDFICLLAAYLRVKKEAERWSPTKMMVAYKMVVAYQDSRRLHVPRRWNGCVSCSPGSESLIRFTVVSSPQGLLWDKTGLFWDFYTEKVGAKFQHSAHEVWPDNLRLDPDKRWRTTQHKRGDSDHELARRCRVARGYRCDQTLICMQHVHGAPTAQAGRHDVLANIARQPCVPAQLPATAADNHLPACKGARNTDTSNPTTPLPSSRSGAAVFWRLERSPPTAANQVRFLAISLPEFSHVEIILLALAFRTHFASPSSALKTSSERPTQISPLSLHHHDGNTARLVRRSDEAPRVRVRVARIAPSLLDLGRGVHSTLNRKCSEPMRGIEVRSSTGIKCPGGGGGCWEIPEKTRRPATSTDTIPTCENLGVARPGIEPEFALVGGEQANRSTTATQVLKRVRRRIWYTLFTVNCELLIENQLFSSYFPVSLLNLTLPLRFCQRQLANNLDAELSVGAVIFSEKISRQDKSQKTMGSSGFFDWLKHVSTVCARIAKVHALLELRDPEWISQMWKQHQQPMEVGQQPRYKIRDENEFVYRETGTANLGQRLSEASPLEKGEGGAASMRAGCWSHVCPCCAVGRAYLFGPGQCNDYRVDQIVRSQRAIQGQYPPQRVSHNNFLK
ncbi:hypothetical protein PR048_018352 [Dryococelus australis]|uniref:Uncharacterized protein n=1 Tax=Dryococelus australis TaxID=614101 RepID=A0ABQ9HC14_9NEOP|nr:hypothetical protein PR048_018352 [Dryococelus australis]